MRRRLWELAGGEEEETVGDSLLVFRNDARKGIYQRAQISGEVTMKGGREGFAPFAEFGEAGGEGAGADAGGDGDVVGGGGRFEGYDGHGIMLVPRWGCLEIQDWSLEWADFKRVTP